ncbi:ligase-associated DNA damage response exonuclease [Aquisphaera insulae]|uniref:ligase-associated DNA damage response exonuclease n=1 Tax=Aquisphaera insulae TaxID=2712864 RepID=UPI0020306F08|nr:ligase-associated DNA damage response exonuclease [Aquisphaera insulae]
MMPSKALLEPTDAGLYCAAGDFHVDPWRPVPRAVVTHAHADHACWGCGKYLTSYDGRTVLRARVGETAEIETLPYGETLDIRGVRVSFHPAGHILGSSQVRVEHRGEVWVASGDYKTEPDLTCASFEPVRCHTFISESTFGLPIYRWQPQEAVFDEVLGWWRSNQEAGKASLVMAYALGKSQRILAGLAAKGDLPGPIYTHGAVEVMTRAYRAAGVALPATTYAGDAEKKTDWSRALIVAPPSVQGTPWLRRFGPISTGFASGWMRIRGPRRRKSVDRGFVLSDHVDWPSLLAAIDATGAERVLLTHGYTSVVARWLQEQGKDAGILATRYTGERDDASEPEGPVLGANSDALNLAFSEERPAEESTA